MNRLIRWLDIQYLKNSRDPQQAMAQAYTSGGYTLKAIAKHFGVHYSTVSRTVRKAEDRN